MNETSGTAMNGPSCPPIQSFRKFCTAVGISQVTGWRIRTQGKITTINISGRLYVTAEAVAEFKKRAVAGEFEKASTGAAKRKAVLV